MRRIIVRQSAQIMTLEARKQPLEKQSKLKFKYLGIEIYQTWTGEYEFWFRNRYFMSSMLDNVLTKINTEIRDFTN